MPRPDAADRARRAVERGWADVHVFLSADFVVEWVSESVAHVTGWEPSDLVGRNYEDFLHPDTQAEQARVARDLHRYASAASDRMLRDPRTRPTFNGMPVWFRLPDGAYLPMDSRGHVQLHDPAIAGIHLVLRDRRHEDAEDRLMELVASDAPLEALLDAITDVVTARLPGTEATVLVPGTEVGRLPVGVAWTDTLDAWTHELMVTHRPATLAPEGDRRRTAWGVPLPTTVDGQAGALVVWTEFDGPPPRWLRPVLERTARLAAVALASVRSRQQLRRAALVDGLTGVANRRGFAHFLAQHRPAADRSTAVIYVDVDDFKTVNDRHGHVVGDEVLRQFAERIGITARRTDLVARLGGDEFCIVCTDLFEPADAHRLADRLRDAFAEPFRCADVELRVGASIGVAVGPDTADLDDLTRRADADMYRAKSLR